MQKLKIWIVIKQSTNLELNEPIDEVVMNVKKIQPGLSIYLWYSKPASIYDYVFHLNYNHPPGSSLSFVHLFFLNAKLRR